MKYLIPLFFIVSIIACDLEQEISINLPEYESQLIVECYLKPYESFSLLLSRSAGFFEPFATTDNQFLESILEDSAEVVIRHDGNTYELKNRIAFNPATRKLVNYFSSELVPGDFGGEFELDITTQDGKTIHASAKLLEPIPIDSIVVQFNDSDTLARVLTYFTDIPGEDNFFRRQLHLSSLDSVPKQDFTTDDRVVEDVVVFGTGYDFKVRDTIINTLYHIDAAYYDFLESVEIAVNSNGNPFGQPSPIVSHLEGTAGATGVFTGISYDREFTIIKK